MKRHAAGSEWRKWDLHVHVPGTKLSDEYETNDGKPDWDRFAEVLEASDVAVFGITDYFSAENSIGFIDHFSKKFPKSEKLLLVNVELRLNETVNGDTQMVDFHVVFRDTVPAEKIQEYLSKLKTQITDVHGRAMSCLELTTSQHYTRASVTRQDIKAAFEETFGPKVEPSDYLIYIAPANNNGLRAESGNKRKANLADEIDKVVHAVFGKSDSNAEYYLRTDRFEDDQQVSKPKPVFGGSDARSFDQLDQRLGKAIDAKDNRQVITWIKADPTFEGLQQTLVEPRDRVSLAQLKPDAKDPYKVIRKVSFKGSNDFPEEILFNPNLNAIIGSRSSGKSALLAHIAYAVDAEYTVKQQMLANGAKSEQDVGPAAGRSWKSVEGTVCTVEWADGATSGGKVIYVPQNWLYQISDSPKEVTDKIRPVLEAQYPASLREHERLLDTVKSANESIRKGVERWFEIAQELKKLSDDVRQVGDKKSIVAARDDLKTQVETMRAEQALSAEDLKKYQHVVEDIGDKNSRLEEIKVEIEQLGPYTVANGSKKFAAAPGAVSVEIYLTPELDDVPEKLSATLTSLIEASDKELTSSAEVAIVAYRAELAAEQKSLKDDIKRLESDNKSLIEKHKANAALDELVKRQKAQQDALEKIEKIEKRFLAAEKERAKLEGQITGHLATRATSLNSITRNFNSEPRTLDQLVFGIATGFDTQTIKQLSEPFRKNERGTYLTKGAESDPLVDVEKAQTDPSPFMQDLFTKKQKLNQNYIPADVAKQVLTATPEVRFTAELDQDKIGGFAASTMTPGKQALFALTLILGEAEDRWALLIDQPEDDLDSRSIFVEIVRYLVVQKKQRQIILVTHNANLVVGADAEEVLVANRHGDDRKNRDARTFDYLTGSLEHSEPIKVAAYDLERMGIREHAVDILDGGEEAFQKRRNKYKL